VKVQRASPGAAGVAERPNETPREGLLTSGTPSYYLRADAEAVETAGRIWDEINEPNLVANILPTRERADLVLRKARDHAVEEVRPRKL